VWIVTAWLFISPEVTVQGFKKYSTFNAVDGTDCVLWNCSEQDGNVRSEREEDEGTNCDDGDSDTEQYR
jgi:hypothetical protein